MRRLRKQVDRIDLKILQLLQQRTRLSRQIGEAKRRHGGAVYVPGRERELLLRVERLGRGKLPAPAIPAIFREIMSSSRAAQGQGAIGLLEGSAATVLPLARWRFGACDEFWPAKAWPTLARRLAGGSMALALLTGADLVRILQTRAGRRAFQEKLSVAGEIASDDGALRQGVFIVTPRQECDLATADRMVILIECKTTADTVKNWLKTMAPNSIQIEKVALSGPATSLLRLTKERPGKIALNLPNAVLGAYRAGDEYGG